MSLFDDLLNGFPELATARLGRVVYVTDSDGKRLTDSSGTPLFSISGGVPAIPSRASVDWQFGDGGATQKDLRAWTVRTTDATGFDEGQHLSDGAFVGRAISVEPTPDGYFTRVTVQHI